MTVPDSEDQCVPDLGQLQVTFHWFSRIESQSKFSENSTEHGDPGSQGVSTQSCTFVSNLVVNRKYFSEVLYYSKLRLDLSCSYALAKRRMMKPKNFCTLEKANKFIPLTTK